MLQRAQTGQRGRTPLSSTSSRMHSPVGRLISCAPMLRDSASGALIAAAKKMNQPSAASSGHSRRRHIYSSTSGPTAVWGRTRCGMGPVSMRLSASEASSGRLLVSLKCPRNR